MEIVNGFMIMAILLGLLLAAAWLSMPILLVSMTRRLAESRTAIEELTSRIASLEDQMTATAKPPSPPVNQHAYSDTVSGGTDGTA